MKSPLKCWKGYKRKPGTTRFSKGSCVKVSPNKIRMGEFKESDAPDAKGKFKTLPPRKLAQFIKRTRKTLSRSIASLNQQIVFNRRKNPRYAAKMKTTQNIVRKLFGKKKA